MSRGVGGGWDFERSVEVFFSGGRQSLVKEVTPERAATLISVITHRHEKLQGAFGY